MLRILHIINALTTGGAEQTLCTLARHQRAQGHVVQVLTLVQRGALADGLAADGIAVRHVPFAGWWQAHRLAAVADAIRAFAPDRIHTHLFAASLTAAVAARGAGYTGRFITSIYETGYWMRPWHRLAERLLIVPRADAVIADSPVLPAILAARGYAQARLRLVYPLVARVYEMLPAADAAAVLLPARLDPVKGHDVLLTALARHGQELPHLTVTCAGDGPLRAALTAQAPAGVRFAGNCPDLPVLLRDHAIVVLPSREETTPLALLEAMAAGRAIVASALPGITAILRDGEEALLVPPGDADALAAALRRLHDDAALRARLGAAARARYAREFSTAHQLRALDGIYGGH